MIVTEIRVVDATTRIDAEADFRVAVEDALPALHRLVWRLAPSGFGEDIIQEALTRAWRKRAQYDPRRGAVSSWLLAIAADQCRKARRPARSVAQLPEMRVHSVDDRLDLEQAIRALSRRQRTAVDCYYFADLSIAQTAAVMNCSEGTVKSTLSDARARLRQQLEGAR